MQIAKNVDEWLIIHRGAVPGSDHRNEQLGHQHTIFTYCGWHPKLVEPHRGHGGIFDKNDQPPEMIWHTTNYGLRILQICSHHQGQAIQIGFPTDQVREHTCLLDVVQRVPAGMMWLTASSCQRDILSHGLNSQMDGFGATFDTEHWWVCNDSCTCSFRWSLAGSP